MTDNKVMWRQDYEELPCADTTTERVKLDKPIWHDMGQVDDVELLLRGKVPVICKRGEEYTVNNSDVFNQYKKQGKKVTLVK